MGDTIEELKEILQKTVFINVKLNNLTSSVQSVITTKIFILTGTTIVPHCMELLFIRSAFIAWFTASAGGTNAPVNWRCQWPSALGTQKDRQQ